MTTQEIHDGRAYYAAYIPGPHGGVCITRKRGTGGVLIRDNKEWLDAFLDEDFDTREALCRAALNS